MWFARTADEDAIKDVAVQFAVAVDTQDQGKFLATLCTEERDEVTESEDFDPDDSGPGAPDEGEPLEVTDVTVKGDVAELQFLRPRSNHSGSLYLRKEAGLWKMCSPAEEDFSK